MRDNNWIKSSFCNADKPQCVEVMRRDYDEGLTLIYVRDSKQNPTGDMLGFTPEEWKSFVMAVKAGEFDLETLANAEPKAVDAVSA